MLEGKEKALIVTVSKQLHRYTGAWTGYEDSPCCARAVKIFVLNVIDRQQFSIVEFYNTAQRQTLLIYRDQFLNWD